MVGRQSCVTCRVGAGQLTSSRAAIHVKTTPKVFLYTMLGKSCRRSSSHPSCSCPLPGARDESTPEWHTGRGRGSITHQKKVLSLTHETDVLSNAHQTNIISFTRRMHAPSFIHHTMQVLNEGRLGGSFFGETSTRLSVNAAMNDFAGLHKRRESSRFTEIFLPPTAGHLLRGNALHRTTSVSPFDD